MSRTRTALLLTLAVLATLTLGCGLLDSLTKKATETGGAIVQQGKATIEAAVTKAVSDAPSEPETEPTEAPSGQEAKPTEEVAEPTAEPVAGDAIDLSALADMKQLDSFRMTAVISWTQVMTDGTSESGAMEMNSETDRASQSSRLRMIGQLPSAAMGSGEASEMELIQIGTAMYMNTGDGDWIAMQMSPEDVQDQFGWDTDPRDFAYGDGKYVGVETVNGYEAKRYHYDESEFGDLGFGEVDESSSDVWVAKIGNGADALSVIVKVSSSFKGVDVAGTEWSGGMRVDVTDINEPVVIEPPEGVEPPGMPDDVPLMDGATNVQSVMGMNSFEVDATVEEVTAFYDEEMVANGWTLGESALPEMRTYTKDARTATLIVEAKDAGCSVTLMIAEQ